MNCPVCGEEGHHARCEASVKEAVERAVERTVWENFLLIQHLRNEKGSANLMADADERIRKLGDVILKRNRVKALEDAAMEVESTAFITAEPSVFAKIIRKLAEEAR